MSFQSKDPLVLDNQLKVQQVVAKMSDQFVTTSGVTVTINVGETIGSVRCAIHVDDSVGLAMVSAANRSISGTSVTLTLANAMASADSILLCYEISE